MRDVVRVELHPAGVAFSVERGAPLRNALSAHGLEFPCSGRERCGGCRIRTISGLAAITPDDSAFFSEADLAAGWRLGCHLCAGESLTLEVDQWKPTILGDDTAGPARNTTGLGVAVDLGTTTVVAQLLDLQTGQVLGVQSNLNPQAAYGSDIMSRMENAMHGADLTAPIRSCVGAMIRDLAEGRASQIAEVVLVGNTVMHHLFCGLDVAPLSHVPFQSSSSGEQQLSPLILGWNLSPEAKVRFLSAIGGFVGSDILAGIVAVGLNRGPQLRALIDLGTNGEIAIGNETGILCASTAAGTAFEAGNISMGMRAVTGAISHVSLRGKELCCSVIGDTEPCGLCGSGLVDAVACLLEGQEIRASGRFSQKAPALSIAGEVRLTQRDVRELQLAKGAIAAGVRILLDRWGAVGNYVSAQSAIRIGLLAFDAKRIHAAGNTALRGAKTLLTQRYEDVLRICRHVSLASDPRFQETFAESLAFPELPSSEQSPVQRLVREMAG